MCWPTECAPPPLPHPMCPSAPPETAPEDSSNQFAQLCDYTDHDKIASDPDDDVSFEHKLCAPENDANDANDKTQSSGYIITGRACCTTARHIASSLSNIATKALVFKNADFFKPSPKSLNCCVDAGTMEHMFPDKAAYHPIPTPSSILVMEPDWSKKLLVQQKSSSMENYYTTKYTLCTITSRATLLPLPTPNALRMWILLKLQHRLPSFIPTLCTQN